MAAARLALVRPALGAGAGGLGQPAGEAALVAPGDPSAAGPLLKPRSLVLHQASHLALGISNFSQNFWVTNVFIFSVFWGWRLFLCF